jgi:hypothetical protein
MFPRPVTFTGFGGGWNGHVLVTQSKFLQLLLAIAATNLLLPGSREVKT